MPTLISCDFIKKIQETYPEWFVTYDIAKQTSVMFSEFLPSNALSNPEASAWGQYVNRDRPPKRKTIMIAFNELDNASFSELAKIDEAARLLKRMGFTVLIPVGEALQDYDMQLFDRQLIAQTGNHSRAQMQALAIKTKKIPADDIFFIDEEQRKINEHYINEVIVKGKALFKENLDSSEKHMEINKIEKYTQKDFAQWQFSEKEGLEKIISALQSGECSSDVTVFLYKFPGSGISIANALQTGKCPSGLKLQFMNEMNHEEIKAIAGALKSGKCPKSLILFFTPRANIGDNGVETMAEALVFGNCPESLTLKFFGCKIGEKGVRAIAHALVAGRCPRGLTIDFSYNSIGDEGVNVLIKALRSEACPENLTLNLCNCNITDAGFNEIAAALESGQCPDSLKMLLGGNKVSEEGKEAVFKAMLSKKCPEELDIGFLQDEISDYHAEKNITMLFYGYSVMNQNTYLRNPTLILNAVPFVSRRVVKKSDEWCSTCEALDIERSETWPLLTGKKNYPELRLLKINHPVDHLDFNATKLYQLEMRVREGAPLKDLIQFPRLNQLTLHFDTKNNKPVAFCFDEDFNHLTELKIVGDYSEHLEEIKTIMLYSPNLQLLDLSSAYGDIRVLAVLMQFSEIKVKMSQWKVGESSVFRLIDLLPVIYDTEKLGGGESSPPVVDSVINEVSTSAPSQSGVVYSAKSSSSLQSDFNTAHNSSLKHTLFGVCQHLSKNQKQRFKYARNGIYGLNKDGEYEPVRPHEKFNYPIPFFQGRLPTDRSHDFYEFTEGIELTAEKSFRLESLSAHDQLFQIKLNGKALTNSQIDITKDELGFYTVTAKVPLSGKLSYIFDIARDKPLSWARFPDLESIIKNMQTFPSSGVEALTIHDSANSIEKLEAMYEQKKAACGHRVAILLHKIEQLKLKFPKEYENIVAVAVHRGGNAHADVQLSIDGGQNWSVIDLGGYETQEAHVSSILPPIPFSSKVSPQRPKLSFEKCLADMGSAYGKNALLCLKDDANSYACLSHIKKFCAGRPIFYVNAKTDLKTSLRRLHLIREKKECEIINPPAGPMVDFLKLHGNSDPPPIIVINWANFDIADMVQFNSVIDSNHRRVDTTDIPAKATIVGLHTRNEKLIDLLADASFVSRHASGGIHDFSELSLSTMPTTQDNQPSAASAAAATSTLTIHLHHSPRWKDILLGKAYLDGNTIRWEEGKLLALLRDSSITRVEFIDPPVGDPDFNHFMAELEAGEPLRLLDQVVPINRKIMVNLLSEDRGSELVPVFVTQVDHLVSDASSYIVNSTTFEQCLYNKKIDEFGILHTTMGLVQAYEKNTLNLCLSDHLSDPQWSLLLEEAAKHHVKLNISLLPGVEIISKISTQKISAILTEKQESPNRFVISDDVEYSVLTVQEALKKEQKQAVVVDFSEIDIDNLFCKIDYQYNAETKRFEFTKQYSDVWHALESGKTVILKGRCSPEMLNYLVTMMSPRPYLMLEGRKHFFIGKLIVVSDNILQPPAWLAAEEQKMSLAQKIESLKLSNDAALANKPFVQLMQEKEESTAPILNLEKCDPEELSLAACKKFEENRLASVEHILKFSPFALLEGPPGVGKSYFMRTLKNHSKVKFYRENEIEKWATEKVDSEVKKILFRDEINLRGIDCSQDRDLLNDPPSIFVNGKYYVLTPNCKIMYAQNPLDYSGDRHDPKLFQDLPNCKYVFENMSKAFVLHRILKPIFETIFTPQESEEKAITIIKHYFSSMRSIRDLQTKAIFECAKEYERKRASNTGEEVAADPINRRMTCIGKNDFVLTPSRYEPYKEVLTLLQARRFRRELSNGAPDSAKYNGVNGLVLQGPPGVGKSEFIEQVLRDEGYVEVTNNTPSEEIESGSVYFHLKASLSNEVKLNILHAAFQKGAVVVIDEIDSCPLLENYLNAYLVGEDIHGKRADKPGFTVLSTANGAGMKGRRMLPEPLLSRMLAMQFNEYPREDLIQILEAMFIPARNLAAARSHLSIKKETLTKEMIVLLVDDFLTQQNTASSEITPTFRDLYVFAKNYFHNRFDQYVNLELSPEQHKFMLTYQNHPHLDILVDKLSLNSKMLPAEMKKSLEIVSDSSITLFGNKPKPPELDSTYLPEVKKS